MGIGYNQSTHSWEWKKKTKKTTGVKTKMGDSSSDKKTTKKKKFDPRAKTTWQKKVEAERNARKVARQEKLHKKRTGVKGTMEGSPTNTTGAPSYKKKKTNKTNLNNLVSNPQAVPGKKAVNKKAPIAPSMYGKANQGIIGKAPKSNVVRPSYMKAVEQAKKRNKKRAQGRNIHKAAQGLLQRSGY